MEIMQTFFSSGGFIPHGHCYLWKPELVWLHLLSDLLIAIAYYSIPIALVSFVQKREDLPYGWVFLLFSLFIILCGTTHLLEIWTLWHPTYWLSGAVKSITAIVSVFTASSLIPLIPKLLSLPSPSQLETINQALAKEIVERKRIEMELSYSLDLKEAIYNESTDAKFLVDSVSLLIIDCNKRAVEMFEANHKEELIGIEGRTLQKRQFTDEEIEKITEEVDRHGVWSADIEYITKKGKNFWGNLAAKPITVTGQVINLVLVKDITDRKHAEEYILQLNTELEAKVKGRTLALSIANAELVAEVAERKQTEERFALALKNSPITVFMQDRDLRYTWIYNPALGNTYDSIVGKQESDIFEVEEDAQRLTCLKRQVLESGMGLREEVDVTANNEKRYFDLTIEPLRTNEEITGIGCVALDITWRKRSEEQLRAAYNREIVLIKEVHHRVKNNLQIISGLLYLQARQHEEPKTRQIIQSCRDRIQSMALIHEKLYRAKDLEHIDFASYIGSLTRNLSNSYGLQSRRISLVVDISPIHLDIDTAIYCGLIVNELVSNAYKYAFPEECQGEITIGFHANDLNEYILSIRDNGIGMSQVVDLPQAKSLGLQLVYSLATQQLGGSITMEQSHGLAFRMSFTQKI